MNTRQSRSNTFLIVAGLLSLLAYGSAGCEPPQASRATPTAIPTHFDTNIDSNKLVIVKFGATWCPPCRDVERELDELAGELPADVEVLKIDVDENPELAERYGIFSIPKLMLVRDGKILDEEVGYMSGSQIQKWISKYPRAGLANE